MSKVAVIGVGNMGYAYVQSVIKKGIAKKEDVLLFDVSEDRVESLKKEGFTNSFTEFNTTLSEATIVVLAVKPQYFADMSSKAGKFIHNSQVLVSIMAGVKARVIEKHLMNTAIVRAMPNTPCMLNEGVTGIYVSSGAKRSESLDDVRKILLSTGQLVEVDQEEDIDTVTSISGSGPAYFYYYVQSMVKQGVEQGLSLEVAERLANYTMKGAFHMIEEKGDKSIQDLIDSVTSKGGTTIAALDTMRENGVGEGIMKGVKAAQTRAGELSDMIEQG